ncbi:MAG TPA: DUF6603 domain-containing protein [Bacteroidia bacterium]|nr:DUF6603 domain-containing protein [Bacteroidia bacterium]
MPQPFYPSVNQIINTEKIPEPLKTTITNILNKLFYRAYYAETSALGDTQHYNIIIVTRELGLNLFGGESGFELIVNPGVTNDTSEIQLSFQYNIPILKFIRGINLQELEMPEDYFNLFREIVQFSPADFLTSAVEYFYGSDEQAYENFVDYYNTNRDTAYPEITYPVNSDGQSVNPYDLWEYFANNGLNIYEYIFDNLILVQNDVEQSFTSLFGVFKTVLGDISINDIIDLFLPKITATISDIKLALAFPRTLLLPIDANGEIIEDEETKAKLVFNAESLIYSTESGLDFENVSSISTETPVMLGKTGLIANIKNLKFDLRNDRNIPEIDQDGRATSFKGIYVESCEITLPNNWVKNGQTNKLIANDLIIGTEDGISGKFSIANYPFENLANFEVSTVNKIHVNQSESKITVEGPNNTEVVIPFDGTKDVYIRDTPISPNPVNFSHYYKVDKTTGAISTPAAPSGLLNYKFNSDLAIALDSFSIEFSKGEVVSSCIIGTLTIRETAVRIAVTIDDGLLINATVPGGQPIIDNNAVTIILNGLTLGRKNDISIFGFAGKGLIKSDNPFVQKFIPNSVVVRHLLYQSDNTLEFDVGIGWKSGFSVTGNDKNGLQIVIPINRNSDNDPAVKIDSIKIVAKKQNGELDINTSLIGATLNIGVVKATVNGLGFTTEITFPEGGGNLGDANARLALLPPTGIGIKVEGGAVTGGGFLDFDSENGRYSGALDLAFTKLSLAAIGILLTKLPGGKKGFSLLALISVKFDPAIQLGLGFTLGKVGGVLGLHRIMNPDSISAGVRDGSMAKVMFPNKPSENAPTIISQLESYFPSAEGSFVFGPMAEIGWGTPTLISLELALIIQINPFNIGIAGVLRSLLPSVEKALLKLQVAFFGEINIPKKFIKFDASIFDSTLLTFSLSGDMVARVFWGDKGGFLISVGGFHPNYTVPAEMEIKHPVRRLSITLIDTNNFKLKSEAYFAVTSNTVQFGTKVELYAGFSEFSINGLLQFDALIYFKPSFSFQVGLHASVSIKVFRKNLMGIDIKFDLSGPNNWHAKGVGKFEVLFIDFEIDFDKTWGERKADDEPPAVNVYSLFENAIKEKKNWELIYEQDDSTLINFREVANSDLMYLPGSLLTFNQRIVPLGVAIDKYGNRKVIGQNQIDGKDRFEITGVTLCCDSASDCDVTSVKIPLFLEDLKDQFAPGEFFSLSNSNDSNAKAQSFLKTPSFESYKSGVTTQLPDDLLSPYDFSYIRRKNLKLQEIYIDSTENDANHIAAVAEESNEVFNNSQWNNSSSLSELSPFSNAAIAFSPTNSYSVSNEKFIIVNTNTFDLYDSTEYDTENEASQALKYLIKDGITQAGDYIVIPDYELAI